MSEVAVSYSPEVAKDIAQKNLLIHQYMGYGEGTYGFHQSWEYLMRVIERIDETGRVSIEIASRLGHGVSKTCTILSRGNTIDITTVNDSMRMAVFYAVAGFIEADLKLNS